MAYVEWLRVAGELGLEAREPRAPFAPGASFRRVKRSAAGRAAAGVGAPYAWLFGERAGVEVFVVVDAAAAPSTFVGARVQPEVGAGLWAATPGPYAPYGGVRAGDPVLDATLRIGAREAASAEKLLGHADKAALSAAAALGAGLLVTDSVVCVHGPGVVGAPAVLGTRLDAAARAAAALGDARAELGPSKEQRALAAAWAPAAEAVGLSFDPKTLEARGSWRGCATRLALESELARASATLSVTFPTVLGFGLGVRREVRDPLETLFAQAAPPIGDPAFDAIVSVQCLDPTPRSRLGLDHALRAALADLALRAEELAIDDAGMWVSFPSPLAGPGELAWMLGAAQLVAFHLAGIPRPAAAARPYR